MKNIFFLLLGFLLVMSCQQVNQLMNKTVSPNFDWQGHRGARGLMPENSIPGFIKALEFDGITTLELDVVISQDSQSILSHEPWFSEKICTKPDGSQIAEEEAKALLIYHMDYKDIKFWDCGSKGNERFPEQRSLKTYKPSLMDMVSHVELHCQKNNLPKPNYNIELKAYPDYYGKLTPHPPKFVQIVLDEIDLLNIKERVSLQSFDLNILKEIHKQDTTVATVFLVENTDGVASNLKTLGFTPTVYSPYYMLLNTAEVAIIKQNKMKLIPWTVNDKATMQKLINLGVDGIITDYPNLIIKNDPAY